MTAPELTIAQQRILDDVRRDGQRRYNGRARKPIEALEAAGLVTVDWDMHTQSKGSGIELTWNITVRPRIISVDHAEVRRTAERLRRRRAAR